MCRVSHLEFAQFSHSLKIAIEVFSDCQSWNGLQ